MSKTDLIPGLAAYMEDTNIDIEVEVGTPEEVAVEAEETAEVAEEVVEADAEVQEEATEAEMILARYDELDRLEAHVAKFGVDRTFLSLMNYDDKLSKSLNITIPSMESFDAVGNPQSVESIACQEGFAEAAKSVWEFIKKMATKIKAFIGRIIEAVRSRLTSLDANIGRLRKAHADRIDDPEGVKGVEATVYAKASLDKMLAKNSKEAAGKVQDAAQKIGKLLSAIDGGKKSEADAEATAIETVVKAISDISKAQKKNRGEAKKVKLASISWADAKTMLDSAASIKGATDALAAAGKVIQTAADQAIKVADKMKTRGDEGGKELAGVARKAASFLNQISSGCSSILANDNWVAGQYVRTAGLRITRGSKKKD